MEHIFPGLLLIKGMILGMVGSIALREETYPIQFYSDRISNIEHGMSNDEEFSSLHFGI